MPFRLHHCSLYHACQRVPASSRASGTSYVVSFRRSCAQSAFKQDSPSACQGPRNLLCCSLFHSCLWQFLHTLYKGLRPDIPLEWQKLDSHAMHCHWCCYSWRGFTSEASIGSAQTYDLPWTVFLYSQVSLVRVCRQGGSFHLADFPFPSYFPLLAEPRLHEVEDDEQSLVGLSHSKRLSTAGAGHLYKESHIWGPTWGESTLPQTDSIPFLWPPHLSNRDGSCSLAALTPVIKTASSGREDLMFTSCNMNLGVIPLKRAAYSGICCMPGGGSETW